MKIQLQLQGEIHLDIQHWLCMDNRFWL